MVTVFRVVLVPWIVLVFGLARSNRIPMVSALNSAGMYIGLARSNRFHIAPVPWIVPVFWAGT